MARTLSPRPTSTRTPSPASGSLIQRYVPYSLDQEGELADRSRCLASPMRTRARSLAPPSASTSWHSGPRPSSFSPSSPSVPRPLFFPPLHVGPSASVWVLILSSRHVATSHPATQARTASSTARPIRPPCTAASGSRSSESGRAAAARASRLGVSLPSDSRASARCEG